jgi:hypothetical protein
MKIKQPKYKTVTLATPFGKAGWVYVNAPKMFEGDKRAAYRAELYVTNNDAEGVIAAIEKSYASEYKAWCEEVGKKAQKAAFPWLENDGVTKFNFKVADAWPDGTSRQPELTDMDKKPITANIGKDSIIRIMFRPHYYNASAGFGVQLQPIKVQVKDLVTFGGGSSADIDFEDVSDSETLKTGTDNKEISW